MVYEQKKSYISIFIGVALAVSAFFYGIDKGYAQSAGDGIQVEPELVQAPTEQEKLVVHINFDIPEGLYVYTSSDHFFKVADNSVENLSKATLEKPETQTIEDISTGESGATTEVMTGKATVGIKRAAAGEAGDSWLYEGSVQYQACSDTTCYTPQTVDFTFSGVIDAESQAKDQDEKKSGSVGKSDKEGQAARDDESDTAWQEELQDFTIGASKTGYVKAEPFADFLRQAKTEGGKTDKGLFSDLGQYAGWLTLVLILLGGVALNLTPCVLPMIPVNLAIIGAGNQARSRKRGLLLGGIYGIAIALVYGLLGLVVVLSGKTFGTVNSSPWFNLAIAVLFIVLGVAVLGFFNIDFSRFSAKIDPKKWVRGTYALAFFMGGVSALLAGACVAPIVIAVLVLSAERFSDGSFIALLYPFILGAGMGLPWPFAGAGISWLPKPGGWMNAVKYIFGIFIIVLAVYYGYTSYRLFQTEVTSEQKSNVSKSDEASVDWHHTFGKALAKSRETGKPVFIDFWASWCKNCHLMDRTTFKDPEVQVQFRDYVLLKYQAEDPQAPETKKLLQHFDVMGLPTYVVLHPPAKED